MHHKQKKNQDMNCDDADRRIILLGKTGNGKSSTGNSLLGGKQVFTPAFGLTAGTLKCQVGKGSYGKRNLRGKIIDTPGLMDMKVRLADLLLEIQRSLELCPGPHAFLLIFSSVNRMTKDEDFTADLLRVTFGEKVFDHCIIVFTHGGRFNSDEEFEQFWKKSEMIVKLVKKCRGRITRIENKSSMDSDDNNISKLIEMIEATCRNGKEKYQYQFLNKHKKVMLEHQRKHDGTGTVREELSSLVIDLGKVLGAETWKVMLVGGIFLAATAVGVGAVGYGAYVVGATTLGMVASSTAGAAIVNNAGATKKNKDMDSDDAERRIILIGQNGKGKSSTGNSLLGGIQVFRPAFGQTAGTLKCKVGKGYLGRCNLRGKIVDTPGLMDMNVKLADLLLEIQRSLELCPAPHAFLLIFSSVNRMTKDEDFTVDLLRVAFGEKVFDHCIIVFTHGGCFNSDEEFEQFWKKSEMIVKLVEKCGGRITRIENKSSMEPDDNYVSKLIEMIEATCRNGKEKYQYRFLDKHKKVILEHQTNYDGTGSVQEELSSLVKDLGKVLSAQVWKVMLLGRTLTALSSAGVDPAGYGAYVIGGESTEMGSSSTAGTTIVNNAAAIGGAAASTAWSLATKVRFW